MVDALRRYERDGEWLEVPAPVPLRQVVRAALLNALAYTDGNASAAARLLGLRRSTFHAKLKAYGIPAAGVGKPGPRPGARVTD